MDNEQQYLSVGKATEVEIEIKKSKFICYIAPIESEEGARQFVEGIKKKHWDATHNVPAWRVGYPNPAERFSDDGEPAGTAGMPELEVLRKQEITNCVVVVTRYFGGTLLGAGGLVRAYTESTVKGIEAAGVVVFRKYIHFTFEIDYSLIGAVTRLLEDLEAKMESPEYGAAVTLKGNLLPDKKQSLENNIAEFSQGQVKVKWGKENFISDKK